MSSKIQEDTEREKGKKVSAKNRFAGSGQSKRKDETTVFQGPELQGVGR